MKAYVDSSVILRFALGQPGLLEEWDQILLAVSSSLASVECLRTLDRFRLAQGMGDPQIAATRALILKALSRIRLVDPTRDVLTRASDPLPTALGTLDAIHLTTALQWQASTGDRLVMATHDGALGMAARACGMEVVGV